MQTPKLAGNFRVAACHEGSGFFVPHLDEPDLVLVSFAAIR